MKLKKLCYCVIAFIILLVSCAPRLSENTVKTMLEPVLQDDLSVIMEGIDTSAIMENPYYEYTEFNEFKEGRYQYLAEVSFYFLRDVRKKIVRKYRFDRKFLRWERYYNEWQSY